MMGYEPTALTGSGQVFCFWTTFQCGRNNRTRTCGLFHPKEARYHLRHISKYNGPGCGTWTHGLLIPNQARYQTAPIPDIWGSVLDQPKLQGPCSDLNRSLFLLVLQTGIEPVTSRLSVVYSNHLSYWSIFKAGNFSDSNGNWTRLFFVEGKCHIQ